MNWMRNAAVAALMMGMAMPVMAQQREGEPARARTRAFGGGVESVMRMRETLKLNDAQINQLEALRKEIVAQRQNEARDMIDLQSRIAAGQIDREAARKQMQSRRESMRNTMEQRRERLERILSAEQHEQLQQRMRSMRAEMRGQRGRGGRPGMAPRGRGFDRDREPPIRGRYRWN
jgi:Spy/CpxP family protein refolding chaperone